MQLSKYMLMVLVLITGVGCSKTPEKLDSEFDQIKQDLENIMELLRGYPLLINIRTDSGMELAANFPLFDSVSIARYKIVQSSIKKLGVLSVSVVRSKAAPDSEDLKMVAFQYPYPFYDWSETHQILYVERNSDVNSFIPPHTRCTSLESPNWYLCSTDNSK